MAAQESGDADELDALLRQSRKQERHRLRREMQRIGSEIEWRERCRDSRAERQADGERVEIEPAGDASARQKQRDERRRGRRRRSGEQRRHLRPRTECGPAFSENTKAEKANRSPMTAPVHETPPARAISARASSSSAAPARMRGYRRLGAGEIEPQPQGADERGAPVEIAEARDKGEQQRARRDQRRPQVHLAIEEPCLRRDKAGPAERPGAAPHGVILPH